LPASGWPCRWGERRRRATQAPEPADGNAGHEGERDRPVEPDETGHDPANGTGAGTIAVMDLMFLATAKPWTYWIAPLLVLMAVLGLLSVVLQYVFKVNGAKYPKS
jgi:hypothetical protein